MRLTPQERAVLKDFGRMDAIVHSVSKHVGYPVEDLIGRSTERPVTRARWLAMKRCRVAGYSLTAIGRYFDRDHTSVIHALQKLRQLEMEAAE